MPKYSQNFLRNPAVAEKIAFACLKTGAGSVLEIGPGQGFLTSFLIEKFPQKITAVEIDPKMEEILKNKFNGNEMKLIRADFLEVNIDDIISGTDVVFAGNLPYAVASPILQKVLGWAGFRQAVF